MVVGNHVTLLKDGPATYRAMFAAIRKARDHIHLETYIFEDDEVGQKFSELLIAKQKQGVQVAILYDSVGAINASRSFFDRLEENGVRILEFNPINPLAGKSKSAPDHRDHRKSCRRRTDRFPRWNKHQQRLRGLILWPEQEG